MQLEEKVALITGGAVRVGRTIALALAAEGCDVVIHYRSAAAAADDLAEELRAMGRQAWIVQGDLAEEDLPENILRAAWDMAGWIDILVNNASCYKRQPLVECTLEDFDANWRVNALAPMLLTKTLAECVSASEILPDDYLGHVINILDRSVAAPDAGALPYWTSKSALNAFTRGAALELAPRIAVNGVAPGPVLPPPEHIFDREAAGNIPLAVRPTPQDVARAVVFLVTSRCTTGQVIFADGGQHLGRIPHNLLVH
jgi:NAD(P)-dependent dehydrogenase (short-subunit alcohol dehydrogenase family)